MLQLIKDSLNHSKFINIFIPRQFSKSFNDEITKDIIVCRYIELTFTIEMFINKNK